MTPPPVVRLLAGCALLAPAARALTATGLSSFEAIEEPRVKFFPATGKFAADDYVNITDRGNGVLRMTARYNDEWWDGDRDTRNRDRQRAEVKGLGPHQFNGDTFIYATTWRLGPGFHGPAGFCHLFQLKAVNGDSGAPLVTLSIHRDRATVEANTARGHFVAREFSWKPDTWTTVRIRVRTSPRADGELLVSLDGDPFQGVTHVELSRPDADEYRPKWGLYRRAAAHEPLGDDFVEHKNVQAQNVDAPPVDNAPLETAARAMARSAPPEKAIVWLQTQPASAARDFAIASLAALWAETNPFAAMEWAEARPAGAARLDALGRIFSRWADRDVTAAAAWLHTSAPRPALDPLVWLFVTDTTYRYVNRPVALAAAPLITDAALRAKAFEHVLLIWARQEPADAAAFLARESSLTAAQKDAIAKKIRAPRGGRTN